jgi:hypothetical protein
MARRRHKKKGSRKGGKAIPVAVVGPLVISGLPVLKALSTGNLSSAAESAKTQFASTSAITTTYVPFLMGVIAHKVATKVGVNRYARKLTFGYLEV